MDGACLIISVGEYGGFYIGGRRICLGWISFTFFPTDIDNIFDKLLYGKIIKSVNEIKE